MNGADGGVVTISIPREAGFATVAGLVVGGIAARHEMTIDVLDDLQLALDTLLEHEEADEGEISLVVQVDGESIEAAVGPVGPDVVSALEQDDDHGIGLRRLLRSTVDDVSVAERDGGHWVELRKGYVLAGADG